MLKVLNKYNLLKMRASGTRPEIKTFVFLDLETTGLPFYENNTTKITELCITAVQAEHIRLGVFPRVQNKLNLCFNPCKLISADAEKITGLSNNLLEHSHSFSKETVSSISQFLNHNPQPTCLVAHNGFKFDYPLLKREIDKTNTTLNEDILCIDTLITFRELDQDKKTENMDVVMEKVEAVGEHVVAVTENVDMVDGDHRNVPIQFTKNYDQLLFSCEAQAINETTPPKRSIKIDEVPPNPKKLKVVEARRNLNFGTSYKLGDVFSRLTKKQPINSHQADGDVQMLIMCAATLGDKFVDWCNNNAKKFCDIPAMVPGRKIGVNMARHNYCRENASMLLTAVRKRRDEVASMELIPNNYIVKNSLDDNSREVSSLGLFIV